MQKLKYYLLNDLEALGLKQDFELIVRPYSKSFYGLYNPNSKKLVVYAYEDESCRRLYSYEDLLLTAIHEAIHCRQWSNPNFNRIRGVMHDTEFKQMYAYYSDLARAILLIREVRSCEKSTKRNRSLVLQCN